MNARKVALGQSEEIHEYRACPLCSPDRNVHFVLRNVRHQPRRCAPKIAPTHNRYRMVGGCNLNRKGLTGSQIKYQVNYFGCKSSRTSGKVTARFVSSEYASKASIKAIKLGISR